MEQINVKEVKYKAKQALSGRWGIAICALVIVGAINSGGYFIDYVLKMSTMMSAITKSSLDGAVDYASVMKDYHTPLWVSAISIIFALIAAPLYVGCAKLFIGITRGHDMELSVIFKPFKNAPKIVFLNIYTTILVFLQTLLFIIPGIIAAYRYALVTYIVAEDEDISITDAVKMSKELMQGHKFKLFIMQISFIGWGILSLLTCGILAVAYVNPYYNAAMAEFYNEVSGKIGEIKEDPMADDSDNTWGDGENLY